MPGAALGSGQSTVVCTDGVQGTICHFNFSGIPDKWLWNVGVTSASDDCSTTVFAGGYGIVREDDVMAAHPDGVPCTPVPVNHTPALDTYSSTVYIDGKRAGRIGDTYNKGTPFVHTITTGSSTVIIG
jgi:uncharacterized Zn-binding protein involved in type VI secretion